ncbi:hypothetical protein ABPG75_009461 [Micractinium tetrahymenae]
MLPPPLSRLSSLRRLAISSEWSLDAAGMNALRPLGALTKLGIRGCCISRLRGGPYLAGLHVLNLGGSLLEEAGPLPFAATPASQLQEPQLVLSCDAEQLQEQWRELEGRLVLMHRLQVLHVDWSWSKFYWRSHVQKQAEVEAAALLRDLVSRACLPCELRSIARG